MAWIGRLVKQVKSMTTSDYFTMRQVFTRYGISEPTLRRWLKDQALGFPRPFPSAIVDTSSRAK